MLSTMDDDTIESITGHEGINPESKHELATYADTPALHSTVTLVPQAMSLPVLRLMELTQIPH